MLDMRKYNEASQHDSTTQVLYLRLREPYISYTQVRVTRPSIQVIQAYKPTAEVTCLSTDNYKWRRLRSLTIYKTLSRTQDRSWGNKLNVEVHAELLVRLKSLCKKHKIGKREYKCTQQDLHQIYLHMHHCQQRGGGVWPQQASFDSVAILNYDCK